MKMKSYLMNHHTEFLKRSIFNICASDYFKSLALHKNRSNKVLISTYFTLIYFHEITYKTHKL